MSRSHSDWEMIWKSNDGSSVVGHSQTTTTTLKSVLQSAHFFLGGVVFLGPHPWHMEVPKLGVELKLLLTAYARATAMPDPSWVCDLHCSPRQHWILNPLSEARDGILVPMDTLWVRYL